MVLVTAGMTGCSDTDKGAAHRPAPSAGVGRSPSRPAASAADRLAGLVALAADRHYTATYRYRPDHGPGRVLTVTLATDGSWRVDVPGGGRGGAADLAMVGNHKGVYQCGTGDDATCVKLARPGRPVPARYDPLVEGLFTRWLHRLGDRNAALSVAPARATHGLAGSCFSVEPTAASLSSPVPDGVYCLAKDGTMTGARLGLGTVTLSGKPGAAPGSVALPGPVTDGSAVPTATPSAAPTTSGDDASGDTT